MPKQDLYDGLKPEQRGALDEVWFWERPALKRTFQAMNREEYGDMYSDNETYRKKCRDLANLMENEITDNLAMDLDNPCEFVVDLATGEMMEKKLTDKISYIT